MVLVGGVSEIKKYIYTTFHIHFILHSCFDSSYANFVCLIEEMVLNVYILYMSREDDRGGSRQQGLLSADMDDTPLPPISPNLLLT